MDRRQFSALAGGTIASIVFGDACRLEGEQSSGRDGRITARPTRGATERRAAPPRRLGIESGRDASLHVPSHAVAPMMPLLVLLHGAGGSGEGILGRLGSVPDDAGVAVLAPDSRGATWDAIRDRFGRDVDFLNRALERVFDAVAVDPERIAIGGFSDGATYALSLGLVNGDLFRRIVAFSPGFIVDGTAHGKPAVFISHGTSDPILPIDETSRIIVPALRRRGHDVTFREFDGRHQIPPEIAREGLQWLLT